MNEETRRDAIARARLVTAIRSYLDGEGFVEVETPILQPRYGGAFAEPCSGRVLSVRQRTTDVDTDRLGRA